jgi:hypothetical protein
MKSQKQIGSEEIELKIQKLVELEAAEFAKLEQRYTEEDMVYAWGMGYEARKKEEKEWQGEIWWTP